jgi:hypothetical protein
MADAIARAEESDEVDDSDRPYAQPRSPRRAAGDVYTFRLPQERRDQLREAAERQGVPPATLIRRWIEVKLDRLEANPESDEAFTLGPPALDLSSLGHIELSGNQLAQQPANLSALRSLLSLGEHLPSLAVEVAGLHATVEVVANHLAQLTALPLTDAVRTNRVAERHVVPHPDGGWAVRAPGAKRASVHVATQAEAVERAQSIVANHGGGEIVISVPEDDDQKTVAV